MLELTLSLVILLVGHSEGSVPANVDPGLVGTCNGLQPQVDLNVTLQDLQMHGNCVPYTSTVGCDFLFDIGVDHVFIPFSRFNGSVEAVSNYLDTFTVFVDFLQYNPVCQDVVLHSLCYYYFPPCGNATHFFPPPALCHEDCVIAQTSLCEIQFTAIFSYTNTTAKDAEDLGLNAVNCSDPGEFINPLPHCCFNVINASAAETPTSATTTTNNNNNNSNNVAIIIAVTVVGVGLAVIAVVCAVVTVAVAVVLKRRKTRKKRTITRLGGKVEQKLDPRDILEPRQRSPLYVGTVENGTAGGQDGHSDATDALQSNSMYVPADAVQLLDTIGKGEFGVVYRARLTTDIGTMNTGHTVAVKTLKPSMFDCENIHQMMEEAVKMKYFDHINVLGLIGVCIGQEETPYLVMPFMANGSLLSFLRKERVDLTIAAGASEELIEDTQKRLLSMCLQIAQGMEYLAEQRFVHRDLAARNCMIDENYVIKVADFGLSEDVYTKNYFRQEEKDVRLPLKWMALESIHDGIFDEKTDVWSFGVTCWEVFTAGKSPYPGVDPFTLVDFLDRGERLKKPFNAACSDEIYEIAMQQCWRKEPDERPPFADLSQSLSTMLEQLAGYVDLTSWRQPSIHSPSSRSIHHVHDIGSM